MIGHKILAQFGSFFLSFSALIGTSTTAWAQNAGDAGISFPGSQSPVQDTIENFHNNWLLPLEISIAVFVLLLLIWVCVRYNAKANPVPSKNAHNTLIEVIWTIVPVIILIVIAVPSWFLLKDQLLIPDGERFYRVGNVFAGRSEQMQIPAPEVTVKAIGNQWFWTYNYPDVGEGDIEFDSNMLSDEDLAATKPGQPRLYAVDNELVLPAQTTVRVLVTSRPNDVIHAFALPNLGVRIDAVPGRVNETWFYARKAGIYYGPCSELCGVRHGFMPIAVRVVERDKYDTWVAKLEETQDVVQANQVLGRL